jgi:flagellar hook-associated protein 2
LAESNRFDFSKDEYPMTTTSTPVSVASSSSAGAAGGSVIDVSSLVSQLVAATQAPQAAVITSQTKGVTTEISALGTLKGALSAFQSSLSTLDSLKAFGVQTASTSDKTIVTATATSSAVAGNYSVTVSNLAQAQQLVSKPIVGGSSAVLGTGTLTIQLGANSFNLAIDSTDDTPAGIAAAINSATDNPGVSATVITGTDGAHLVLSSSVTGAANTIQVSETDGGTALSSLTYNSGSTANYAENSKALDAVFSIAGVAYKSPSNTTSALSGVTLNLTGVTSGTTSATVTVASDTATISTNVSAFVDAYNTMQTALATLGSYDASSGTAGPMLGDPMLQGVQSEIRQTLNSVVGTGASAYNTLVSVGITTNSDGSLSLDSAKLSAALNTNINAVSNLFGGTTGVATTLNTQITNELAGAGPISSRSQSLLTQENALTQRQTDLTTQMAALSASLTQQFSALDTLLSTLQTTSSYLSQAFSTLPQVQGKASG